MTSFTDILNRPAETIERPKPRPPGTYLSIVTGPHKQKEVNDKPVISITFKTAQAMEDVDQASLAEAGGVGNSVTQDFFLVTNDGNENSWPLKHEIYTDKNTGEPAVAVRVAGTAKV